MAEGSLFHIPSLVQQTSPLIDNKQLSKNQTVLKKTENVVTEVLPSEYKGVFHEHKVLIVFCAIVILVAVIIVLMYYFSKRDLPNSQMKKALDPKVIQERKMEEQKMDTDEAKEREKIRRINEARKRAAVQEKSVKFSPATKLEDIGEERAYEKVNMTSSSDRKDGMKNNEARFSHEQKIAEHGRSTFPVSEDNIMHARQEQKGKNVFSIDDIVGETVQINNTESATTESLLSNKPSSESAPKTLEEHQKQNIVNQSVVS